MGLDLCENGSSQTMYDQGESKPGCRIVLSVTIVWLTTEADDQSSLHCVIVSTDVMSDNTERRDASRGRECSMISAYKGQFGRASMIWSIFLVAALRHREGGATLLSAGKHESCVGCRQPEIRPTALWSWVSMSVSSLSFWDQYYNIPPTSAPPNVTKIGLFSTGPPQIPLRMAQSRINL